MSPSRQNNYVSMYSLPLSKSSYSVISAFCTEDNISPCISYINQVWKCLCLVGVSLPKAHYSTILVAKSSFFHRSSTHSASPPYVSRPAHPGEPAWARCQLWMPCTSCSRFTGATCALWRSWRRNSWRKPAPWSTCRWTILDSRYA